MAAISPARTKYRKSMKGSRAGNAKRGNTLAFGEFGLQSLTRGPMTGQQIEAARVTISRHLKRKGKLWIRISRTSPSPKSRPRSAWAKARGRLSTTSPLLSRELFSSNLPVFLSRSLKRRFVSLTRSYRFIAVLSRAIVTLPNPNRFSKPLRYDFERNPRPLPSRDHHQAPRYPRPTPPT